MILPVKIGRDEKWGRAGSERFVNRNKRNAFIRFILKEQCLKCVFRHFTYIRNRPKNGCGRSHCFPMEMGDEIFYVVSVAPKAKSGESLGSIGDKK